MINSKLLRLLLSFFLAFQFMPSCSQVPEPHSVLLNNQDAFEKLFFFDPISGRYQLIGNDNLVTKSGFDEDYLLSILKRNNSLLDSIIREELRYTDGAVYVIDDKSGVIVKALQDENDSFKIESLSRDDSTFFEPGVDSLEIVDSLGTPQMVVPSGTLYNGGSDSVFAPYFMKGFHCTVLATAPLAVHFISTRFLDTNPVVKTCYGIAPAVDVPVKASNIKGTISFSSTDANGPVCMYSGYPTSAPSN